MNLAICSAFRNSAANLQLFRFLSQVVALRGHLGPSVHVQVLAGEGDSVDGTAQMLVQEAQQRGVHLTVVDTTHGGRRYGSVEDPQRMKQLSGVCNKMLDAVSEDIDVVFYVESDLIWDPYTVGQLLELVRNSPFSVVAPLTMAGKDRDQRGIFYDVWAFRKDGERFGPFYPYHPTLVEGEIVPVDSVGSCFVMTGEVARTARIRNNNALVGFCEDVRAKGHHIGVRCDLKVAHPA